MTTTADPDLERDVAGIANRRPCVGLAVGVVRDGALQSFAAHGLADVARGTPVTRDTVFRIASVTKTMTAVAVLQLHEQGLVDLDAPADTYLRAYRLVPSRPGWRPPTLRQLLTHTAGIREVLHPWGLLRMRDLGETVPRGRPVPSAAEFYDARLLVDAQPGTRFMYTDHGFVTLGQVVEDVAGTPLDRYLRDHVFDPLGMTSTDLGSSSSRVAPGLATAYELRSGGPQAVSDYEVVTSGGGGVCASPRDMARYLAALLGGGGVAGASILAPASVAALFAPQYRPDPRIPGLGLAFFRADLGGHLGVEHDGILPGFDAQVFLAPDDGVAVMAFATGAQRGMHWLTPEVARILRRLIGAPEPALRTDLAHHPERWPDLCGWYRLSAHRTDPARFALGGGVRVAVRGGRLLLRVLSPIPALARGFALHPDDADDPDVFRIAFPWFGIGTARVVFSRNPVGRVEALHLDVAPLSFERRPCEKERRA